VSDRTPTETEKYQAAVAGRADVLRGELESYGTALLPGAARVIADRNPGIASLAPDMRAEKVAELMDSPLWQNFLNPEHAPPALDNGQPHSPLRAALVRNQGRLRDPGKVDELVTRLSAAMIGKSPAKTAGAVVRFLNSPEAAPYKTGFVVSPADKVAAPPRAADGTFQEPPRRRSTF
jgi:hypothetical protein